MGRVVKLSGGELYNFGQLPHAEALLWLVIRPQAKFGSAKLAARFLHDQAFRLFVPQYWARTTKCGEAMRDFRPLFTGYLFVGSGPDQVIKPVNSTRGVGEVLSNGEGRPAIVPGEVLSAIQDRIDKDGGVAIELGSDDPEEFKLGDRLRIEFGAFVGFSGLFQKQEKGRVEILLDGVGVIRRISLPRNRVARF